MRNQSVVSVFLRRAVSRVTLLTNDAGSEARCARGQSSRTEIPIARMVMVFMVTTGPARATAFRLVRKKYCPSQNFKFCPPTTRATPVFRKPFVDTVTVCAIKRQILFKTGTLSIEVFLKNADSVCVVYPSSFAGNALAVCVKL